MSKDKQRYYAKRERYLDQRMASASKRESRSALKAVGLMFPIIILFYLVLYLKDNFVNYETYFSDYESAVGVWSVGMDFFKTIMNTLDSITTVLGKVLDFIVKSVDAIIAYITDLIDGFQSSAVGSWLDDTREWFKDIWLNLIPWTAGDAGGI